MAYPTSLIIFSFLYSHLSCIHKVQESGAGYTLSGKTLDPDSAAARPYLSRVSHSKLPSQGDSTPSQIPTGLNIEVDSPSTSPRSSPVPFAKNTSFKRYLMRGKTNSL